MAVILESSTREFHSTLSCSHLKVGKWHILTATQCPVRLQLSRVAVLHHGGKSVAQYYLRGKVFTEIAFTVFSEAGGTVASSAAASFVKQVVTHDTTTVISKTCYLGIGLLGRAALSSVNKQIKLEDRLEQ